MNQEINDDRPIIAALLSAIKNHLPQIKTLLEKFVAAEEDSIYRFYHQSFKVFDLQQEIAEAVALFRAVAPDGEVKNVWFAQIVENALQQTFQMSRTNPHWTAETRPILEAFWHCRYFLEQFARFGEELDAPPALLPSGWASILYLYGLR